MRALHLPIFSSDQKFIVEEMLGLSPTETVSTEEEMAPKKKTTWFKNAKCEKSSLLDEHT